MQQPGRLPALNSAPETTAPSASVEPIQPLGEGSYDVGGFLRKLRATGYTGPIGFQGHSIAMILHRKIKWDPRREQSVGDAEAASMLARPKRAPWDYQPQLKT